jgi:hypothetical protein
LANGQQINFAIIMTGTNKSPTSAEKKLDVFGETVKISLEHFYAFDMKRPTDQFGSYVIGANHTGSAIEYFTWLKAKLDSIEAMPSSRVSLFFRKAS